MKVTIACISPYLGDDGLGIYMIRTYGRYILWAKKSTERYSTVEIKDCKDWETIHLSLLEKKVVAHDISAIEIAQDFMQYANLKNEGGMIIEGDKPTDTEIAMMQENRQKWLTSSIAMGDMIYQRLGGPGVSHIPDYAKRAAAELGEYPEWTFRPTMAKEQCLNCGTDIKILRNGSRPRICANCKDPIAVVDPVAETEQDVVEVSTAPRAKARKE